MSLLPFTVNSPSNRKVWTDALMALPTQQKAFFAEFMSLTLELSQVADRIMQDTGIDESHWDIQIAHRHSENHPEAEGYQVIFHSNKGEQDGAYLSRILDAKGNYFKLGATVQLDLNYRPVGDVEFYLLHGHSVDGGKETQYDQVPLQEMLLQIGTRRLDLEDKLVSHARFFASRHFARLSANFARLFQSRGESYTLDGKKSSVADFNPQFEMLMRLKPNEFGVHRQKTDKVQSACSS